MADFPELPSKKEKTSKNKKTSLKKGFALDILDAYMEELSCVSCNEFYNEDEYPPLTTNCGHTFCGPCISAQLVKSRSLHTLAKCYSCGAKLDILNASDLPVNHTIVKLAGFLTFSTLYPHSKEERVDDKEIVTLTFNTTPNTTTTTTTTTPTTTSNSPVVSKNTCGECKEHKSPLVSRCTKCKVWMCDQCVSKHLTTSLEEQCEIVPVFQELRAIKESQSILTGHQIDKLNILKGDLLARIALLNTQKKKNQVVIATLKEELLQIEANIRGIEQKKIVAEEKISEVQSWIETLLESRSRTFLAETVEDVETSQEETNRHMREVSVWIRQEESTDDEEEEEDTNIPIPRASGPVGLEYLKQRVLLSQQLYTIDYKEGVARWAKLAINDQCLILRAHTTVQPPIGATIVPYKELTDAMPSLPDAFFDISWDDQYQGRVFFELFNVNNRSLQYLLLCMGDWGPCYKDTKLMPHGISYHMSVTDPTFANNSILYGGNYNQGLVKVCPALYDKIKDGGEYSRPKRPGLLAGMPNKDEKYLSMFKIYLEVQKEESMSHTAFGQVKIGLPVLQAAATKLKDTTVTIQDCGLAFPLW